MRALTIDQLAKLDERSAVERHFDQLNDRFVRVLLIVALINGIPMLVIFANEGDPPAIALAIAALISPLVLALLRRRAAYDRNPRPILITWVVVQFALILLPFSGWGATLALALVFPLHFLVIRYRPSQYIALASYFALAGVSVALLLHPQLTAAAAVGIALPVFWLNAALATAGIGISKQTALRFVVEWSRAAARNAEETRMRTELAAARQIQLSMLPEGPPPLDWIELAGTSLPATEVGGDFFGYYPIDDDRVAVVVADVAGHGVASGIVLASVKGGLHLVQADLGQPATVMARLDRMVRDAVRWRMLVTMLIAVIDRRSGTMQVVTAGHPPLVHRSGDAVDECGGSSLPLGTKLPSHYAAIQRTWRDGDIVIFCTDGLLEQQSPEGEPYGSERLVSFMRNLPPAMNAEAVRSELAAELARFRSDAAQEDDITLVVARLARDSAVNPAERRP